MTNSQDRPSLNVSSALTGVDFPAPASFTSLYNRVYYEIPWIKELTRKMSQPILEQLTPCVGAPVKMPRVSLPRQEAIAASVMQKIGPFSNAWGGYLQTSSQASLIRASEIYGDVLKPLFPNCGFSAAAVEPVLMQADRLVSAGAIPNQVLHDLEAAYVPDSVTEADRDTSDRSHQAKQRREVFVVVVALCIGTAAYVGNHPDGDITLEIVHGLLLQIGAASGVVGGEAAWSRLTSYKQGSGDTTRDVK